MDNVILKLGMELSTNKEKENFSLTREQVKSLIEEHFAYVEFHARARKNMDDFKEGLLG